MRRIGAWVLLILFFLLLLNIFITKLYLTESVMVYIVIIVAFIFSGGMRKTADITRRPVKFTTDESEEIPESEEPVDEE